MSCELTVGMVLDVDPSFGNRVMSATEGSVGVAWSKVGGAVAEGGVSQNTCWFRERSPFIWLQYGNELKEPAYCTNVLILLFVFVNYNDNACTT
jgi:hypothetical protein